MAIAIARMTDMWIGVCVCHPIPVPMAGIIIFTSYDGSANNIMGMARLFDITIGYCGHPGIIVTSSFVSTLDNFGIARRSDVVVGCNIGVIVGGSPDCVTT